MMKGFAGLIKRFLAALVGEGFSTGNEEVLIEYPELGASYSWA